MPPSCSDIQKKSKQSLREFITSLVQYLSTQEPPCSPGRHRQVQSMVMTLHYCNLMYFYVIAPDNTLQSPDLGQHTRKDLMSVL